MKLLYISEEMKWGILIIVALIIILILVRVLGFHASAGYSDYDQAKNMCGTKGVAHFSYIYHESDSTEQPDITCK